MLSTNLPAANAEKEAEHIALLLLLKFLEIFEGTHFRDSAVEVSLDWEFGVECSIETDPGVKAASSNREEYVPKACYRRILWVSTSREVGDRGTKSKKIGYFGNCEV